MKVFESKRVHNACQPNFICFLRSFEQLDCKRYSFPETETLDMPARPFCVRQPPIGTSRSTKEEVKDDAKHHSLGNGTLAGRANIHAA